MPDSDEMKAMPAIKDMTNAEAIQMLQRCSEEIAMLRAQRDALAPKAEAYDAIVRILGLLPTQSRGYGEDLNWTIKKRIAELQSTMIKPQNPLKERS